MLEHLEIFFSLALSFSIVYFVIPKIIKVSKKIKLYDVPNHRSAAKKIVPTLGGIAIFAGFIISLLVSSGSFNISEFKYLLVAVIVMFLVGLKDDIIGLSAKKKLVAQIVIALYLVVLGNYRISHLHGIFGIQEINYTMGVLISAFAIVCLINAVNLIDGIDGLAGGIGLLVSLVYGYWFINAGEIIYAICSFSLAGSLIAFLLYNVFGNTNKIFMGDTGSLILGTIIAVLTLHFNVHQPTLQGVAHGLPALSLAIIIVPVIDTIRIFAIRISQGHSPFTPDMNHIHHNLLKLTGNHLATSAIMVTVNGIIIWLAFNLMDEMGNNLLFITLLATGFILGGIPSLILKWQGKATTIAETKSILGLSIFHKKQKD